VTDVDEFDEIVAGEAQFSLVHLVNYHRDTAVQCQPGETARLIPPGGS